MPDGSIKPCAIKRVQYITAPQQACVQLELGALQDVLGKANLVQCLGAVEPSSSEAAGHLTILTECAFCSCTAAVAQELSACTSLFLRMSADVSQCVQQLRDATRICNSAMFDMLKYSWYALQQLSVLGICVACLLAY